MTTGQVCLENITLIALRLPTLLNYHKNWFSTSEQHYLPIFRHGKSPPLQPEQGADKNLMLASEDRSKTAQ